MAIERNGSQDQSQAESAAPRPAGGKGDPGPAFSLGQRFSVGLNVIVMVIAAAALLVLVNWIANAKFYHADLSSLGRYSMSERTRIIVENTDKPIRITLVYDSQDPEEARGEYQPRLYDLAEEIKLAGRDVTLDDVDSPAKRRELALRIAKQQGASAVDYRKLVRDFTEKQSSLKVRLDEERVRLETLANDEKSWAGEFMQVKEAAILLATINQTLEEASKEISKHGGGLVIAHEKQTESIKGFVGPVLEIVQAIQENIGALGDLAKKMAEGGGGVVEKTRELGGKVDKEYAALEAKVSPTTQPAVDKAELVKQAAAGLRRIADLLNEQSKLLSTFADDQPPVRGLYGWNPTVVMGGRGLRRPLDKLLRQFVLRLQEEAASLEAVTTRFTIEAIRDYLTATLSQERAAFAKLYGDTQQFLVSLGQVDAGSRKLLDAADGYLADVSKTLEEFKGCLDKLPELKSGGLAEKLKQDNLVILEVGDSEPRVLEFDEVWPTIEIPEPMPGQMKETAAARRTFNGDSAMGSALFSLGRDPIAEVVFVHYSAAPGGDPRMQRQAPDEGDLPLSQLNVLRERLGKANLKVSEWNLASEMAPPPPAYPGEEAEDEEGEDAATTQPAGEPKRKKPLLRVYVVLPPAPPAPSGPGASGGDGFGPGHMEALSDALRDGGRALFLACYGEMRQMGFWAPPMRLPYGWNDYLANEWGLAALTDFRLIQGIPDKEEGKFGVNAERYYWMRLNHFNDKNPVGRPLDARRVLLVDACPVEKAEKTPQGVTYETILDVPYNDRSIWATTRDVRGIVRELYTSGKVTVTPDQGGGTGDKIPPMDVMVQAVREPTEEGQTEKSMIIVFGAGRSLADFYLPQRVPQTSKREALSFAPPPEANAEIAINSIYWLAGQEKWIAAGPVIVPPIKVPHGRLLPIQIMVIGAWPLLVLLIGGAVALWRRIH